MQKARSDKKYINSSALSIQIKMQAHYTYNNIFIDQSAKYFRLSVFLTSTCHFDNGTEPPCANHTDTWPFILFRVHCALS